MEPAIWNILVTEKRVVPGLYGYEGLNVNMIGIQK